MIFVCKIKEVDMKSNTNRILLITAFFTFIPHTYSVSPMIPSNTSSRSNTVQAVVLAAGSSSRFKTPGKSKLLFNLCGQKMIEFPVSLLHSLSIQTTLVIGFKRDLIMKTVKKKHPHVYFVTQENLLGTGHALVCTQYKWHADNILIMNGDMPLITPDIIERLLDKHQQDKACISFVVSHNTDISIGYGRLVQENNITRIVEAKHFTASAEDYPLVNAGIYVVRRTFLEDYLNKIELNKQTNEFYITDLVEIAVKNGAPVAWTEEPFYALHGVNTLQQLEKAERIKQREIINTFMTNGVRFKNSKTVVIDLFVTIEPGSFVDMNVKLLGNTHIGKNCVIESGTTLENCIIKDNVTIHSNSSMRNTTVESDMPLYTQC